MTESDRFQSELVNEYVFIATNYADHLGIVFTPAELQFVRTQIANAISQWFTTGLHDAQRSRIRTVGAVELTSQQIVTFSVEDLMFISKQVSEASERAYNGGWQNGMVAQG